MYKTSSGDRGCASVWAGVINFAREREKESIQTRCGWKNEEKRKEKKMTRNEGNRQKSSKARKRS